MKSLVLQIIRWFCKKRLAAKHCEMSRNVMIQGVPYVRRKGSGQIILGDNTTLNVSRWSNWLNTSGGMTLSVEDGAILELKRGAGVSSSQLIANVGIEVGEDSMIGAGCLICDSDMHEVPLGSGKPVAMAPIKIGKRVFVGARCIILKGVTIGDGAVIGAGSVVSKEVPAGAVVAGNPAVVVRRLNFEC